jgi:hypothetical protein
MACKEVGPGSTLLYDCWRFWGSQPGTRRCAGEGVHVDLRASRIERVFDRSDIISENDLDAAVVKLDNYLDNRQAEQAKVAVLADRKVA